MPGFISRLFSVQNLLPKEGAFGEIPSTKEAYSGLIRIALPSVCEMVLMSLISMVDTMMVSGIGTSAVAAVGLVSQPRLLFMCFFIALNIGVTAIVARRKGENRRGEANLCLRNALIIAIALSAVLVSIGLSTAPWIMRFAGARPGETLEDSIAYFTILIYAFPLNAISMAICAAQRGVGNTRLTMYVNITANLVNVLFNWLLINGIGPFPRLGIVGAAIATDIGIAVGFLFALFSLLNGCGGDSFLHISRHDNWRLDPQTTRGIARLAGSAMLEQLALRFGFFAYSIIVASLGTQAYAAHQIACQFLNLSFTFGDGIGVASTAMVGQMLGRKRPDLAHMYGKIGQRLAVVTAILIASTVALLREPLVGMFVHTSSAQDMQVRMLAEQLMLIVAAFQLFQTSSVVMSGALRGAGDTRYVARVSLLTVAVMRPGLAFLFSYVLGTVLGHPQIALLGCWAASLLDMVTRMTLCLRRFNGGKWHDIRV